MGTFGDAKSVEPLIAILENNSCDRKVRRASAKALQNLYLSSDNSLDKKLKQRILTFNWLIIRMMEDIDKKKEEVLERAKKWWSGKPDPKDNNYVCDACGRKIKEKKGTSLLGSYMRCQNCTERLFERWEENGIN